MATASVAAVISLGGLGRYLIDGIALGDYPRAAGGAVLVAVLAVVLDGMFALVQRRVVSPGLVAGGRGVSGGGRIPEAWRLRPTVHRPVSARPAERRNAASCSTKGIPLMKRTTSALALLAASILGLTACGSGNDPLASETPATTASGGSGQPIVVGGANFSESTLLAEIYAGALRAKGLDATTKPNIGSREIYLRALEDNSVQVFPEYTGALALFYDKAFTGTDPEEVYAHVKEVVPDTLTVLDKSVAEDNDSIVVTKQTATEKGLATIEDLAPVAGDLSLAAPPEFKERPQGIPGLEKTYGVTFGSFRPLNPQGVVQALKNGQVDAANIFSTTRASRRTSSSSSRTPRSSSGPRTSSRWSAPTAPTRCATPSTRYRRSSPRSRSPRCSSRPTSTRRTPRRSRRSSSRPTAWPGLTRFSGISPRGPARRGVRGPATPPPPFSESRSAGLTGLDGLGGSRAGVGWSRRCRRVPGVDVVRGRCGVRPDLLLRRCPLRSTGRLVLGGGRLVPRLRLPA